MNRSILLLIPILTLIGLLAASTAKAVQDPTVCKSVCTAEQGKCMSRAAKMTELDRRPRLEEVNPFPRSEGGMTPQWSASSVKTDQLGFNRRILERNEACTASYTRCTAVCEPDLIVAAKQAPAPAAAPATSAN